MYSLSNCIRLELRHVVVVEWLSADELNKQLTVEENHGCS